jgi:hypothetical protein
MMNEATDYQTIGEAVVRSLPADAGEFILLFDTPDGKLHVVSSVEGHAATNRLVREFLRSKRPGPVSFHELSKPS